ncbi:glutamate ABC transporter substrate-binding protein [Amycolatopsis magusensis]|uniref:Glutamate transport system substrate-binding protein n=1 Tax=Amycolatopsis magusensis TaxID=882444 RepID=A0ABS4PQ89_9PSEU|nr:glutamate ABC transporter substrate-binding protein [Amycolatopsis magusensis]MBP2181593.1 glutamate transport system substrate-binding protein [Amycolatopsis magusensis]
MTTASLLRTAMALGAVGLLVLTGCNGGAAPVGGAAPSAPLSLLDRAPVASEAEIAASPTAAAIRERGQLLIGGELDLPLMSQRNPITGETVGFDATLGKLLAKYLIGEPNLKVVRSISETREAVLQTGTVDAVISTYTITPERARKISFAGPYLVSGQAIATLSTENRISTPADLAGKKVVAVSGTTSVDAIKRSAPGVQLTTFGAATECIQALEAGSAVAYVHDMTLLAGTAQLNDKIQIVSEPFTDESYGIGIRHGDESFKEFVNDWLVKIQQSGLWGENWTETLGQVVPGDPPKPPPIGSVPGS